MVKLWALIVYDFSWTIFLSRIHKTKMLKMTKMVAHTNRLCCYIYIINVMVSQPDTFLMSPVWTVCIFLKWQFAVWYVSFSYVFNTIREMLFCATLSVSKAVPCSYTYPKEIYPFMICEMKETKKYIFVILDVKEWERKKS